MNNFSNTDKNKITLLYSGGGYGDFVMFSRFIPKYAEINKNNKIILLVKDRLYWMYNYCFKNINNLELVRFSNKHLINKFDYHSNISMLMLYLDLSYDKIYYLPYLNSLNQEISYYHNILINNIKKSKNKFVIFNWHGEYKNSHEKYNRGMDLINAEPLFKLPNITWIIVTKDINKDELDILNKHNCIMLNKLFDNGPNAFYDSMILFNHVDYVISTDTSMLHIAGTMGVPTIGLLTLGCEWRWTNDEYTNWYPNMKLIRQNKVHTWDNVIKSVIKILD